MKASILDPRLEKRLDEAEERFRALNLRFSDPSISSNPEALRDLGRERSDLEPIVLLGADLREAAQRHAGARQLIQEDSDPEMRGMAADEATELEAQIDSLQSRLRRLLIPRDPLADRAAVLEVRAGTGGDEAGLFAADLLRMYRRFAEREGLSTELLNLTEGSLGSIREAVMIVRGSMAYGTLRYESGVHRVQRVPETENQGRIHTSAATVAVLPEAEEVDLHIDPNELRIDVFRSSGPGGQSVNTTDSAVRITHLPTGLVVSCQDEKSQLKNKNKGMKVLRSRLLDRMMAEKEAERARDRKAQVGTGDRSAKIRTYNFPQNRVTDHRIGLTLHRLEDILDGDLQELLDALRLAEEEERLEEGE